MPENLHLSAGNFPGTPTNAEENLLARHIASVAAPEVRPPDGADSIRARLAGALGNADGPDALIVQAAAFLRRALDFDFAGAYCILPENADRLSLLSAHGLGDEFCQIARVLPLRDLSEIADRPGSGESAPDGSDFFAPVAAAFGLRVWLLASLADPLTMQTRGAILLGSRDPTRFHPDEAAHVLCLADSVADVLASRFPLY